LLGQHEILLLGCQLSPEFVTHLSLANLGANAAPLAKIVATDFTHALAADVLKLSFTGAPMRLIDLAAARSVSSTNPSGVYLDRPDILAYHDLVGIGPSGALSNSEGFDVVANEVAVRPGTQDPFHARMAQGILDTNLESALLRIRSAGKRGTSLLANAADLLRQGGGGWLVVHSATDAGWQAVQLPADVRARVDADLAAGYVVAVPSKLVTVDGRAVATWWRLDRDSGSILGMGDRGWGQDMTEHQMLEVAIWGADLNIQLFEFQTCMNTSQSHTEERSECGCEFGLGLIGSLATLGWAIYAPLPGFGGQAIVGALDTKGITNLVCSQHDG
jgi:hypothetical protein